MPAEKPILRVLTGCTAVGKTDWALRWAEERDAEIISCDSLLFYRGMDIGTAKPTPVERARVVHHLVDICDVTERMDITRYVNLARAALGEIVARNRTALVVGGSGFYLKAFFGAVADDVAVPPAIREEVGSLTLEQALQKLRELNPAGLGGLDVANPRRVTRALERCLASGETIAELTAKFARIPSPFDDWRVRLTQIDRPPAELAERIARRVTQMLRDGLIDEVRGLLARGLRENPSASRAIGYREVLDRIDGRMDVDELAREVAKNTRALVKKQRTWFRTQLPAHRVVLADTLRGSSDLFD